MRSAWETEQTNIICGHSTLYSQTLPRSGSMRIGRLYPRPAWVPPISANVGSAPPTPRASRGASSTEMQQVELPTPKTTDIKSAYPSDLKRHSPGLSNLPLMLPTPITMDAKKGPANDGTFRGARELSSVDSLLREAGAQKTLPTPLASDWKQSHAGSGQTNPSLTDAVVRQPEKWGRYADAIHRWEQVTRPAPEPTKQNVAPSLKLSAKFDEWLLTGLSTKPIQALLDEYEVWSLDLPHRITRKLSAEFDEWLMGLPEGWISDVPGITWNETLKACGNGVVPQQAIAALEWLLTIALVE